MLRPLLLLGACLVLAALLSSDAIFSLLQRALLRVEPSLSEHPWLGAALFVGLSALSAMLAFFSSAVLVPVAVLSWGRISTIALLWTGWMLGGITAYSLARWLGRPLVRALAPARKLTTHAERLSAHAPFELVLLLQLALPSELPGYLFGFVKVRLGVYVTALAVAELPFAVGTVLLGETVIERRLSWLVLIGFAAVVFSLVAMRLLQRQSKPPAGGSF